MPIDGGGLVTPEAFGARAPVGWTEHRTRRMASSALGLGSWTVGVGAADHQAHTQVAGGFLSGDFRRAVGITLAARHAYTFNATSDFSRLRTAPAGSAFRLGITVLVVAGLL